MPYNAAFHHRRSIRLPGYDYRQAGAYFITLVSWQRQEFFGEILDQQMYLNASGQILLDEWLKTVLIRADVELHTCQVMPNHFHGILVIHDRATHPIDTLSGLPKGSVGAIIGQIKSITTKRINLVRGTPGEPVWQRNYYEHIIRSDQEWQDISDYIELNPINWANDVEHL